MVLPSSERTGFFRKDGVLPIGDGSLLLGFFPFGFFRFFSGFFLRFGFEAGFRFRAGFCFRFGFDSSLCFRLGFYLCFYFEASLFFDLGFPRIVDFRVLGFRLIPCL